MFAGQRITQPPYSPKYWLLLTTVAAHPQLQSAVPFPLSVPSVIMVRPIPMSVLPTPLFVPVLLPVFGSLPLPVPLLVFLLFALLPVLFSAWLLCVPVPPGLLASIFLLWKHTLTSARYCNKVPGGDAHAHSPSSGLYGQHTGAECLWKLNAYTGWHNLPPVMALRSSFQQTLPRRPVPLGTLCHPRNRPQHLSAKAEKVFTWMCLLSVSTPFLGSASLAAALLASGGGSSGRGGALSSRPSSLNGSSSAQRISK